MSTFLLVLSVVGVVVLGVLVLGLGMAACVVGIELGERMVDRWFK